jgi:hypothetical protein
MILAEPVAQPSLDDSSDGAQQMLAEYVDRIISPLVGAVPWERRERFRIEVLTHLDSLVADFVCAGLTVDEAACRAIREHGRPSDLSNEVLFQWYEKKARGPIEKRWGRGACNAFSVFVVFQSIYVFFLQWRVFTPAGVTYRIPLSPAQLRIVWPEPLPFPDGSLLFWAFVIYPVLVPFFAGWLVGLRVPVRAGRAVYNALVPLIFCSFVIGALLLPMVEGLLFAFVQLFWWLPVGCIVASGVSAWSTRSRLDAHLDEGFRRSGLRFTRGSQ